MQYQPTHDINAKDYGIDISEVPEPDNSTLKLYARQRSSVSLAVLPYGFDGRASHGNSKQKNRQISCVTAVSDPINCRSGGSCFRRGCVKTQPLCHTGVPRRPAGPEFIPAALSPGFLSGGIQGEIFYRCQRPEGAGLHYRCYHTHYPHNAFLGTESFLKGMSLQKA